MKQKNKLILFPILIALATSCGQNSQFYDKVDLDFGAVTNVTPYTVRDTKTINDTSYYKMHGRYYTDTNLGVNFFNFSSAGFEVTFVGTTLEACLYTTNADSNSSRPYIAVCIDNDYDPEHATPIQLTNGKHSNCTGKNGQYFIHDHVVLAHDLENKEHTVRVYKRSEANYSKVGVKSFATDGTLLPVKAKEFDLKMEFYGDSVTCGYAVESPDFYENFSTRTENSMKTYANYAANALNADVSHISNGGYPMYKSEYSEGCSPDNIPELVDYASCDWNTLTKYTWDNSKYIPDVVVIALGANDGSILSTFDPASKDFSDFVDMYKTKYLAFIQKLFTLYPNTLIVVSDEILPLGEVFDNAMDEVVVAINNPRVIRAKYNAYNEAKDRMLPGAGHPNKEMQQLAGLELANIIRNALK